MLVSALEFFGQHGRWVLPAGLVAGVAFPAAAEPMRLAIPWCIGALLFLAVLRLLPDSAAVAKALSAAQWISTGKLMIAAQVALPLMVYGLGSVLGVPVVWLLAATLVSAAPPISGSPNLVLLLKGDGQLAMRWLMLGTALLPLTCLPILYLLFPASSISMMLRPSVVLLVLIVSAVLLALLVLQRLRSRGVMLSGKALDGASAIVLALMVIGLMSAVHKPGVQLGDVVAMLVLAIAVNAGLQCLGVMMASALKLSADRIIAHGVVMGNRNIALYLTALPAAQVEPLLLFIACYQVPMYLTPLMGDRFYRRLE